MSKNKNEKPKKKSSVGSVISTIIMIVCLAVMVYAGYRLISLYLQYKAGTDEYNLLRDYTEEEDVSDFYDVTVPEDDSLKPPIEVDFDSLKAINEDIVGWLYMEPLDMSYPVAHGTDNEFYLHHTFQKQYNFAGTIFVEEKNNGDFQDSNTIVYGHNMLNGSMFGNLKLYSSKNLYEDNPYFWILTPEKAYVYQICSIKVVESDGEAYSIFTGKLGDEFIEWANKMISESTVDMSKYGVIKERGGFDITENSKFVTLSTCTNSSATRFVIQGIRLND